MTGEAGIHDVREDRYHADLVTDGPTLSSSIAHLLCVRSPLHAWTAHPRLNPNWQADDSDRFDLGTAAHRILLEGSERGLVIIDADDYRKKDAQNDRDLARAQGQTPLLKKNYDRVVEMVDAARAQLRVHHAQPPLLTDGKPERTIVWEEPNGVKCRALVDWLRDDLAAIDDLKTTAKSADPAAYARALFSVGGDVQVAFYLRGVERLTGVRPEWRWIVVENTPPYALSVVAPTPGIIELGHRKVERAITLWRDCLETDVWPAYPTDVCYAELPDFEAARWLERQEREQVAA